MYELSSLLKTLSACFFSQFNYKKRNQTAVLDEMVQIANYVDSVSLALCFKINIKGISCSSNH